MTPNEFANIMGRAYVQMRPWSEKDIEDVLSNPFSVFLTIPNGGIIARIVAGECEVLALATDPRAQRTGVASTLLTELINLAISQNSDRIFLDVACQNEVARLFYAARGFAQIGERKGYYTLRDGSKDDALLLSRPLEGILDGAAPTS